MTTRTRKKIVKIDNVAPTLVIENGEVKEVAAPVIEENEIVIEEEVGKKPRHTIHTPNGDAVYEYVGDCFDCMNQKVVTPVFVCVTHPIRMDAEIGNQLAAFWNDGTATVLCQKHYRERSGQLPKQDMTTYKVISKVM